MLEYQFSPFPPLRLKRFEQLCDRLDGWVTVIDGYTVWTVGDRFEFEFEYNFRIPNRQSGSPMDSM